MMQSILSSQCDLKASLQRRPCINHLQVKLLEPTNGNCWLKAVYWLVDVNCSWAAHTPRFPLRWKQNPQQSVFLFFSFFAVDQRFAAVWMWKSQPKSWFEVWPQCSASTFESRLLRMKICGPLQFSLQNYTLLRGLSESTRLEGTSFSPQCTD